MKSYWLPERKAISSARREEERPPAFHCRIRDCGRGVDFFGGEAASCGLVVSLWVVAMRQVG